MRPPIEQPMHDRPRELERSAERPYRFGVGRGGEPVFLVVPAIGRRRLAVPGQVEGDDAERIGDRRIRHHVPELAAVGPRRMQANERDALSRLLEVEAMRPALQRHMEIAPDDRIEPRGHQRASPRRRRVLNAQVGQARLCVAPPARP